MVLADTSVWIEHFRHGHPSLASHLSEGLVLMHPFVSGELACGNLKDRAVILSDLHALPAAKLASNAEVLKLIEDRRLWGRGLGWIDVHLLTSALLSNCRFWTLDTRLARAATELGLS
jgi:predicted nucleic acid-binding protein